MKNKIRLNVGCGPVKSPSGFIGIDQLAYPNVDIVGNAIEILKSYPDGSVSEILMSHFLNHVSNWNDYFREMERVLEPSGQIIIISPHFSNPYFYSDPTHVNTTGLYSISYYVRDELLKRKVPKYYGDSSLKLEDVFFVFKSPRPFYFRYIIKRLLGIPFNLTRYMQELYEEFFSRLFYAYEIKFVITKT